jgi:hypothetical protein
MKFRIELVRTRTVYGYAEIVVDAPSSSAAWSAAHDLTLTPESVEWLTTDDEPETAIVVNAVTGETK